MNTKYRKASDIIEGVVAGDPVAVARAQAQAANPNVGTYNTVRLLEALATHGHPATPATPDITIAVPSPEDETKAQLAEISAHITGEVDELVNALIRDRAAKDGRGFVPTKIRYAEGIKAARKDARTIVEAQWAELASV
jgi:hypothetical protein